MLSQPIRIRAVRFQYRGQVNRRGNWENIPFYVNHLRRFLVEKDGEAVWLKGNTGGDEAAYLIYLEGLGEELKSLLSKPLANLGSYEITAEHEPVEILRKYYRDGKIGVGRLQLWEEQVGEPADELNRKVNRGFWLPAPNTLEACSGTTLIKARKAAWIPSGKEWWLQLEHVQEYVCKSDGTPVHIKECQELWLKEQAVQDATWDVPKTPEW